MAYVHRTLIVTAEIAPLVAQLTEALAGPAGAGMFTTPLSATGLEPATHYISSGMIEDTFTTPLESAEALFEAGQGMISFEQAQAVIESSDISDEEAYAAMSRLGLKLVQVNEVSEES